VTNEAGESLPVFEVGVAIVPGGDDLLAAGRPDPGRDRALSGYDEAFGVKTPGRRVGDRVLLTGADAFRTATEAIAGQIGLAAQQIASAIQVQAAAPEHGALGLESVEVSFGITLSAGVQAMFTAQAESSLQVTITLSRPSVAKG
jgi:Trypsin-co-occurring domain 1